MEQRSTDEHNTPPPSPDPPLIRISISEVIHQPSPGRLHFYSPRVPQEVHDRIWYHLLVETRHVHFQRFGATRPHTEAKVELGLVPNTEKDRSSEAFAKSQEDRRVDSVPIWGLDPVSICASTDVQLEPDSNLIPNLPLELQRLLYDSNTRVAREAWDVFYRQNSFSIRKLESLLFRSLGLYQQDASLDFAPKSWIRKFFMNIEIGDRDNFLQSLLSCPSLKKVVFWMHGHDDTFRYLEQRFTVVAHASAMLRAKLGEGFKFLAVHQFYGDWESGLVRGARELRTDMA